MKVFLKKDASPSLAVMDLKDDVSVLSTPFFPHEIPNGVKWIGDQILLGVQELNNGDVFVMGDGEWGYWEKGPNTVTMIEIHAGQPPFEWFGISSSMVEATQFLAFNI